MPVETPEEQQAQNHAIFLEDFFDKLRRKVPLVVDGRPENGLSNSLEIPPTRRPGTKRLLENLTD